MRPIPALTFGAGISIQHKERQLLGTRNKGKEPVISVIHFDGWLDATILQHSHAAVHVPLTTAKLPGASCHWLFWWV